MIESYHGLYDVLLLSILILSPIIFIVLLFISAPYGRHHRPGWGLVMNNKSAWFWMELPAVMTILVWYVLSDQKNLTTTTFLLMWEFHYVYRTILFPMKLSDQSKSFPLMLIISAVIFNIINGTINGLYLFHINPQYDLSWLQQPMMIIGTIIFTMGFIIHYQSDEIILRLRSNGQLGYGIPHGKLFNYVSNPNYLGEFVQWMGWAILTWSMAGLSFALFTLANLLPRAIANHSWYQKQFVHYPKRKILFPFLF